MLADGSFKEEGPRMFFPCFFWKRNKIWSVWNQRSAEAAYGLESMQKHCWSVSWQGWIIFFAKKQSGDWYRAPPARHQLSTTPLSGHRGPGPGCPKSRKIIKIISVFWCSFHVVNVGEHLQKCAQTRDLVPEIQSCGICVSQLPGIVKLLDLECSKYRQFRQNRPYYR